MSHLGCPLQRREDNPLERLQNNPLERQEKKPLERLEDNLLHREEDNPLQGVEDNRLRRMGDNPLRRVEDKPLKSEEYNRPQSIINSKLLAVLADLGHLPRLSPRLILEQLTRHRWSKLSKVWKDTSIRYGETFPTHILLFLPSSLTYDVHFLRSER